MSAKQSVYLHICLCVFHCKISLHDALLSGGVKEGELLLLLPLLLYVLVNRKGVELQLLDADVINIISIMALSPDSAQACDHFNIHSLSEKATLVLTMHSAETSRATAYCRLTSRGTYFESTSGVSSCLGLLQVWIAQGPSLNLSPAPRSAGPICMVAAHSAHISHQEGPFI